MSKYIYTIVDSKGLCVLGLLDNCTSREYAIRYAKQYSNNTKLNIYQYLNNNDIRHSKGVLYASYKDGIEVK